MEVNQFPTTGTCYEKVPLYVVSSNNLFHILFPYVPQFASCTRDSCISSVSIHERRALKWGNFRVVIRPIFFAKMNTLWCDGGERRRSEERPR